MRTAFIGSGIETTALGFGCASLFHLPSKRQRRRVLDAAYDAGIRHFDVAPMYGLGSAEQELGAFARTHSEDVVIATKFGIEPTRLARGIAHLQGPVRLLLGRLPALQHRVKSAASGPGSGGLGRLLYRARGYDAAAARSSLQGSLRRLGREHIDLYLLHEPAPDAVSDDLVADLEDARATGLIRAWGVAAAAVDAITVGATLGSSSILQIPYDGLDRAQSSAAAGWPGGVITYGVIARAASRIRAALGSGELPEWNAAVGFDLADPEQTASMLLLDALDRNPSGIVLYSTTRAERVGAAAHVVEEDAGSGEKLARFQAFLAKLGQGQVAASIGTP